MAIFRLTIISLAALFASGTAQSQFCESGQNHESQQYIISGLRQSLNACQFSDAQDLLPFQTRLLNAQSRKVNIVYLSDDVRSSETMSQNMRAYMQTSLGYGGLGLVIPYSVSHVFEPRDYNCIYTGKWVYANCSEPIPEIPVGLTGFSVRTTDTAATLLFNLNDHHMAEYSRVRLLMKQNQASFDLVVTSGSESIIVHSYEKGNPRGFINVDFKKGVQSLTIRPFKKNPGQTEFELYGISIENPYDGGVVWHNISQKDLTIGQLTSETLLKNHLDALKADAFVVDIGLFDFWRKGLKTAEITTNIKALVNLIKKQNPDAAVIFITPNIVYRSGYSLRECESYSNLIRDFALKNGCLLFDWYWIAGGRNAIRSWKDAGLAETDFLHLNNKGVEIKSELFSDAIHRSCDYITEHTAKSGLVFNIDSLANVPWDTVSKDTGESMIWQYHTVRKGQTIWTICNIYHVTAADVRTWNSLKSNYLWTGQVLKIYARVKPGEDVVATPKTGPIKPKTPAGPVVRYHKVRSGETLSSIARKYNTTVTEIKRLNRISGTTIRIGQVLRVK